MENNRQNQTKQDDFWDLSDLVPKRKIPSPKATEASVEAVELRLPPRFQAGQTVSDVPLTERFVSPDAERSLRDAQKPEKSYRPKGSLVREVRIYRWKSAYTYYEQFRRHAEHLVGREGRKCPEADFFSYMPQYTQLSKSQMDYYFWWRTNFRQGKCLPAAYSYLLLYLYELINLSEAYQDPASGQESMLRLWLSYREQHPRLDALLREWLCDYSLLHALPPPRLDPGQYRTLLSGCRLKEFYVSAADDTDALGVAMLLFCNNYDYTKSKFYNEESKADYDRVLGGAIRVALRFLRQESGNGLTDTSGMSTLSRDTFSGAVCSWRQKRRIEVDYTSFSHTHELRYIMTDVLKYAENALRANRLIKSRLSIYALSVPLRHCLDAYLATALPPRRRAAAPSLPASVPDYEKRYDLPAVGVSMERAARIEAESWQTTKRLVEAFAGDAEDARERISPATGAKNEEISTPTTPTLPAVPAAAPGELPFARALGDLLPFLRLALKKDKAGERQFALSRGELPDAIADKINTVSMDYLGDILLEEEDGTYTVIPDYLDFLTEQGVIQ
ncbi:MAG: hypothetical protein E7585_04580 [Ruminococcaceae bacterium]|nr:hypothetical protein [Oscillospiraceae bacterium]